MREYRLPARESIFRWCRGAIHKGNPTQKLLAYQYLQTLPKLAEGNSNKLWIIPSEVGEALKGIGNVLGAQDGENSERSSPLTATAEDNSRS